MIKHCNISGTIISGMLVSCMAAAFLCGCGSSTEKKEETEAAETLSNDGTAVYRSVMEEEYIDIDAAYEELSGLVFSDADADAFVQKLEDLKKCEGRFLQESESTGNRYTADVSFYLQKGDVYFSMPYSGYMGTIADGAVKPSEDRDYLYESATTGEHYGQEQQFSIHFREDALHVEWGGTCDYVLVRGDGSAEHEQDYRTPFDKTETYQSLAAVIDKACGSTEHQLYYDADSRELNLYMKAPDSSRKYMTTEKYREEVQPSWQNLSDSLADLGGKLYPVLHAGGNGEYFNIYLVEELKEDHAYTSDDYLLWIENDTVKYDIAKDSSYSGAAAEYAETTAAAAETQTPPAETKTPAFTERTPSFGDSTGGFVSSGERNALQKARDYLDVMAFSYTGLIEQLEFEGFSHSEAVYGADNCGADWNEQAVKKARDYLEIMSMSKSQLIEQLEFEGFTSSQARYGADAAY